MSQDYSPSKNWTARELLDWTEDYFRKRDIPSARLDAELLLASALGVDRLGLLTKEFEQVVDDVTGLGYRPRIPEDHRPRAEAYEFTDQGAVISMGRIGEDEISCRQQSTTRRASYHVFGAIEQPGACGTGLVDEQIGRCQTL